MGDEKKTWEGGMIVNKGQIDHDGKQKTEDCPGLQPGTQP